MRRFAVLWTLVALSSFALAGSAMAQDEGGGAADNAGVTTPDSAGPGAGAVQPDTTAPDDAPSGAAVCDPSVPCAAAPVDDSLATPDPFSTVSPMQGTTYDTPDGRKAGMAPGAVIAVGAGGGGG